jgi:hypothetical protein
MSYSMVVFQRCACRDFLVVTGAEEMVVTMFAVGVVASI